MSAIDDRIDLMADLDRLRLGGSGQAVLERCLTLPRLKPIALALSGGAVFHIAARQLLEQAAADSRQVTRSTKAGAAWTGIKPRNTNRGGKSDPVSKRLGEAAKALGIDSGTLRRKSGEWQRCCEEYADAILEYVYGLMLDKELMSRFLRECGVDADSANQLAGFHEAVAGNSDTGSRSAARLIPLSGVLREALEAARMSCIAQKRAFYTPDLLLALLEAPNSRTVQCLEIVQAGLANRIRHVMSQRVAWLSVNRPSKFEAFEWVERLDVQRAQDLAASDGAAAVTELHLLLGMLAGDSDTASELREILGSTYEELIAVVNSRRHSPIRALKTPRPRRASGNGS